MPITFEEVTATVEHEQRSDSSAGTAATPPAPQEDFASQFERALQLRAEREARLSDE